MYSEKQIKMTASAGNFGFQTLGLTVIDTAVPRIMS